MKLDLWVVANHRLQHPLALGEVYRAIIAIVRDLTFTVPGELLQKRRFFRGDPAGPREGELLKPTRGAVLVRQRILDDFELELANGADDLPAPALLNEQLRHA